MAYSKQVCVLANGCPENRIDASRVEKLFDSNGWSKTNDLLDADLILFNACGLTKDSQEGSVKIIEHLQSSKRDDSNLIVFGCLGKINIKRLREVYDGITFGSDDLEKFIEIFKLKNTAQDIHVNHLLSQTIKKRKLSDLKKVFNLLFFLKLFTRFYHAFYNQALNILSLNTFPIKISTGCLCSCSFCGVKNSRGQLKSKSPDKVIKEFDAGIKKGYKEFALIGTDLGAYGRDKDSTLAGLLKTLVRRKGDFRIKLRNVHPHFLIEMFPELKKVFCTGKISFLSSALQSANNRILKRMRRNYSIEDLKNVISVLNKDFPEITLCTQILIGFPGETEQEFNDTVRFLDNVYFDSVEAYLFQPRPNTEAFKMKDVLPKKTIIKRFYKLYWHSLFKKYRVFLW